MQSYIPKDSLALLAKIPAIPTVPRQKVLTALYARLRALVDRSPRFKLLSVLRYVVYIVLILNFGSLPFMWHIRVFWPIFAARLDYSILRLKLVFASKKERARAIIAWGEGLSPVGANPFEMSVVCRRWATFDDCDSFGMHLSNSSYAKALDSARAKILVKCFPAWGRSGGHMALAATHYHFIREIPPLARYEVRLSFGSWDHKWMYIVARFVTRPGRRQASNLSPQSSTPSTPGDSLTPSQNGSADVDRAVAAVMQTEQNGHATTHRAPIVEPDGAILHCVAISQICFKWRRITIPPAVVLASEGFTKPYGDGDEEYERNAQAYSATNPPPNWLKSQSLRVPPEGSMDGFRAFLCGGWRDVPEGERWWEDALGGSTEAKRQANLEILEPIKTGMERTRTLR